MITIPLIMAGGKGERFWPLSRSSRPKQVLPLLGSKTMIEETLLRVMPLCNVRNAKPLVITGSDCAKAMKKALGKSNSYDCIVEPVGKNTAPAVGLGAAWIRKRYGEAIMVVVSADHAIRPVKSFVNAVKVAASVARENDSLVVFGIRPSRPDVGYGYINIGKPLCEKGGISCFSVKRFVEKPSLPVAQKYYKSKEYLWNSGMFVWKTSVILREFETHMPELFDQITAVEKAGFSKAAIDRFYSQCIKESIDFGIMEKSKKISAVCGDFFWDDIGSWESIARIHAKNAKNSVAVGQSVLEQDCNNSIIFNSSNKVVASIGLSDTVLVVTPDAVLAIAKPLLPDLKKYLGMMKDKKFPAELF